MQCSEAAILAHWVQWVQCCWRLAGWLDQVAVPDLWYQSPVAAAAAAAATVCCVALLLSSPPHPSSPPPLSCLCYRACQHNFYCHSRSLSLSVYLCISFYLPALLFLSPLFLKLTIIYRTAADKQTVQALLWMASSCTSGGSVRSSVALQTVSIVLRMTHSTLQRMAVSQTVRQTNSNSANRQTSLQSLQTNSTGRTGRETNDLWQIQPA